MADCKKITLVALLLVQAIVLCRAKTIAADVGSTSTYQPPASLTYEELIYIAQTRFGNEADPPVRFTPCARATLGCCSSGKMNEGCSEALGCGAYFLDDNPCDDSFIISALRAAKTFYEQSNKVET